MDDQYNKQHILKQLEIERSVFEALIAQIHPAHLETILVQNNWTTKDILAHITAWEQELLRWLAMADRGDPPDIPAPGTWANYIDQFNARNYQENRKRPLKEVREDFARVHLQLRNALESLPEDPHDPSWSVWYGGVPPWRLIATFYEHYQEHSIPIRNWLQSAHTRPR
jgi:hypothetical protein